MNGEREKKEKSQKQQQSGLFLLFVLMALAVSLVHSRRYLVLVSRVALPSKTQMAAVQANLCSEISSQNGKSITSWLS